MILALSATIMSVAPQPIIAHRQRRGWSQLELARRAGLPRSSVGAIEAGRLTPAVTAALALAAALECSVEELFGNSREVTAPTGPGWAWAPRQDPARYWEAEVDGRRLLFPVEAPALNPQPHDGISGRGVLHGGKPELARATLVLACCDPAAGLLATAYARETGGRLIVLPRGGATALELLRRGLVHVAGLHYSTSEQPDGNRLRVQSGTAGKFQLIRAAEWETGVAVANSSGFRSVSSLVRHPHRWALREPGSAARECLDQLIEGVRVSGHVVASHQAVADAVQAGWAEAGLCVRLPATDAGLDFLPVRKEQLDFCFATPSAHDPRIRALVRLLRSRTYRQELSELPGYEARETGTLVLP
jgi:molybdate-binding protein/DNA-binding XRE family transcriptional regulator